MEINVGLHKILEDTRLYQQTSAVEVLMYCTFTGYNNVNDQDKTVIEIGPVCSGTNYRTSLTDETDNIITDVKCDCKKENCEGKARGLEPEEQTDAWPYILLGMLILASIIILILGLVWGIRRAQNKKREVGKETIDQNPDYGDDDDSDAEHKEADNTVVDRNDYYEM